MEIFIALHPVFCYTLLTYLIDRVYHKFKCEARATTKRSIAWGNPLRDTFIQIFNMLGALFAAFVAFTLVSYFILKPIVDYFRDPKGLRRYPSLNRFSPFTDLAFIWEAHQGFRSKTLLAIHQTHPVVRIGPNSLSYGDVKAIKVRLKPDSHALSSY